MNNIKGVIIIGLILALPFLASALDEGKSKQSDEQIPKGQETKKVAIPDKLVYKPPLRGAPAGRIGGGSRGATERESFSLLVLAPDHIGLTIHDQPFLYWYISKQISHPVELTITERMAIEPFFVKIFEGPSKAGIQTISLADFGVRLRKDVQYKWFITLVTDADHRSKDILAGGIIKLVNIPESLSTKLQTSKNLVTPYVYAEEGLWYDAIQSISEMIDASPNDVNLRKQRISLLEQVGLDEVAEFESKNLPSMQ
jgi:hypothetical protein